MSSVLLKSFITSLPKILVFSFVFALIAGLLNPIPANADWDSIPSETTPAVEAAQVNLTVLKSHPYVGDSANPTVSVSKSTAFGTGFPPIPSGDYYYAHLYNVDTGEYVSSSEITKTGSITLGFPMFIPEGRNHYQVLLSHEVYSNPEPALDIKDFSNPIGKSATFVYERKPLALSLESPDPVSSGGSIVDYKLNQEINGQDYLVHIFDMNTGEMIYASSAKEDHQLQVAFNFGESHSFQAMLTKSVPVSTYYDPVEDLSHVTETIVSSNVINLYRSEWKVEIKESPDTQGNIYVDTYEGGAQYATYLVDNATNEIVWDSEDPSGDAYYDITNPGTGGISGFTAYVAHSWKMRNSDTVLSPQPETFTDLEDIIADSNGWYVPITGTIDPNQIAGGSNPDEACASGCHGDPVKTSTGEFYDHQQDIETVGIGVVPTVERSFSTINKDTLNLLGYGWRTNYEMKISADSSKENYDPNILTSKFLLMENGNSSVSSFHRKADGSFEGAAKTMAALTYDYITQTFKYTRNNKETYVFNSTGKLIRIQNDKNQIITLNYQNGKLVTVADTKGNSLTFGYNANNLISTITAQNGRVATYTYDTKKQLTKVVNADGTTFSYTYDTSKRIKTLTNELGGITTNTYNTSNQVTKQVDPLGRIMTFVYSGDLTDGTTQIKYPNAKVIEETYKRGQLTQKVENYGKANALTWKYAYDGTNQLMSVVNPDLSNVTTLYDKRANLISSIEGNGNSTVFTYDAKDNLLTAKDPLGNLTTNIYDPSDNLISTTGPLGEKTTFTYNADKSLASTTDARGNLTSANPSDFTSTFRYLPNGLVSGITNALSGTTSMYYNTMGNMVETMDARGNKIKMEYNVLGLPTKVTDPLQNETAMTYDQMGNVLTSKNAKGAITTYTYDILGNRLTIKNALNEVTTYTYNSMNQSFTITLADGTVQTITYDIFGRSTELKDQLLRITKQEWDSNSRLTASINPDGGRTEYTYDTAGNLKAMKTPKGAVTTYIYDKMNRLTKVTDALGRSCAIEYDANGKVIKTTAADGTTEQQVYDAVGNIIQTKDETGTAKTYAYDALNRKISATNELGQVTSYSYDVASNLVSQTRPDTSVVGYTYDARNLLMSIDYQGTVEDLTYTYDELGRKITEKKGTEPTVNYSYDSLNRVISRGAMNNIVAYSYDNIGNLLSLTYPSGRVVLYGYDAAAQLTQLNTTGVGATSFDYNYRSLQTTTTLTNGVTEKKAYDADSQLLSTELTKDATSLYKRTQSYNLVGDVTQRGTGSNGAALTLENFTYDPISRLTEHKAEPTGQSLNSYGYNPVGNLIAVGNKNQTYDAAGKVTATDSTNVTYDARNNRAALLDTVTVSKNVEYEWAQNNLLTNVTTHDGAAPKTVSYSYSADNLLQSRTEVTSTDQFAWDTSRAIPAMLSDGKYEYVYSQDRVPLAQIEIATGTVTYLHEDLTGSVTASTDATGGLVGTVDYSPYGVATDSLLSRFGYAGEWVDATTGYSYLKARWLDTVTGTFLSEDPLVQMTNNAFGYTEGNPITQIDPLGLAPYGQVTWEVLKIGGKMLGQVFMENQERTLMWNIENSGNISAVSALLAVGFFASGIGAPIGAVLGGISLAYGFVGAAYETAACNGMVSGKKCDPLQMNLSWISVGAGALGLAVAPIAKSTIAASTMNGLNTTSTVTGVSGAMIAAGGVAITNEKDECK